MGNCVGGKGSKKDPTTLTDEEIKLLLDNTKLNIHQIRALHYNFLKECPSGKLTKKDFIKLFKEVHPSENKKEKADKFCEYVFKVIDRDNLGYISFQDFVLCFSLTSYGDFKQKCEFAFRLYDLDKDGKISKKEMTQVLEALYDLSGITDRKGDKAPAKIVDDIIKKLNQQAAAASVAQPAAESPASAAAEQPQQSDAANPAQTEQPASEAAPATVDAPAEQAKDDKKNKKAKQDKKPAKEKPAKEAKPAKAPETKPAKSSKPAKVPDFITKEQFIEACNTDEAIKKLFVDSIFASQAEATTEEVAAVKALGDLSTEQPSIVVETSTALDSDHTKDVVTNTIKVDLHESANESTTVVNHSEVIITDPEPVQASTNEQASQEAPQETVADNNAEITQVVEEINNEAKAEPETTTSNEQPPQQQEANTTDNKNDQPVEEQAKPAVEASQSNAAESK